MKPNKPGNNNKTNSLIKAGIGILAITVIGKFALFGLDILLANKLQPKAYGVVAILLSISQIAIIFSNFGISNTLIRFIPPCIKQHNYQKVIGIVKYALLVALFTSLTVLVLSSFFIYLYPEYSYSSIDRQFVLFGIVLGILISFSKIIGAFYQSIGEPVLGHAFAEHFYPIISLLLLTAAILSTALNWMVAMYSFLSAAGIVFAFGAFSITISIIRFRATTCDEKYNNSDTPDYGYFQKYAATGLVIAIGFLGLQVTDKLMLGAMTNMQDVGIYALAYRLSMIITFVVFLFPPILGPYLSRNYGEGTHLALNAYLITSRWTYLITVPVMLSLFFYSEEIVVLIGGEEYAGGSMVLKLLTLSSFLVAATGNNGLLLQMSGKEKTDRNNVMLALALDILLNYLLIPDFHVVGAAIATFAALFLTTILKAYQVWRYWKIIPFGIGQAKGLLSGGLWIATFYLFEYLDVYFTISIVVSSLVYLTALVAIGLTPDDKKIIGLIAGQVKRTRT